MTPSAIVFLLGEELKSTYFFNGLARIGMDYTFYRPDLSELILQHFGFNDTDQDFDFYFTVMQYHSAKLRPNPKSIQKHAQKVFTKLSAYKTPAPLLPEDFRKL